MKAISFVEIQRLAGEISQELLGGQLQEIRTNERMLALGFFIKSNVFWLIVDLHPQRPLLFLTKNECPVTKGRHSRPVGLFLASHARSAYLRACRCVALLGRVLELKLTRVDSVEGNELETVVTLLLIPRRPNINVQSGPKKIYWNKPTDIGPHPQGAEVSDANSIYKYDETNRSNAEIYQQWKITEGKGGSGLRSRQTPEERWEIQRQRDLQKKKKAVETIEATLAEEKEQYWYQLGETLKATGSLAIPIQFQRDLDQSKSFAENLEIAFGKARQLKHKKKGTLERLSILRQEIVALENAHFDPNEERLRDGQVQRDLLAATGAVGRKKALSSGVVAYIGKSGKDNLQILRAAKPWDYWLHLRDYPGAHLILRRQRNQNITEAELIEAVQWLLKESVKSSMKTIASAYDVILTEVRFVRPIKGDRLGRVQYSSERILKIKL